MSGAMNKTVLTDNPSGKRAQLALWDCAVAVGLVIRLGKADAAERGE